MVGMPRSLITIDLGAIRHNVGVLRGRLETAELWAVVKADGYGHGAVDVGRSALGAGATALGVATLGEALELRRALPAARIVLLGPAGAAEIAAANDARLELCLSSVGAAPPGFPVHLKLDTGMGRWGLSELVAPGSGVVGLMSHFATADTDPDFARMQLERFLVATEPYSHLTRHIANSAATLRLPTSHLDAVRCGIALYGISPFGTDPAEDGLRPALRWESTVALVKTLAAGASTGYGRRFVATVPTRIGIVPVGYADGFRRDLTGALLVAGGEHAPVIGTVSMDAIAVVLPDAAGEGDTVTLIGPGAPIEAHARVSGTIPYEIACGIVSRATRSEREIVDE